VIAGRPEALEMLKEEVKKELKEERKIEETEQRTRMAGQMRENETRQWRKKIDEEFPKLAEKIGLSPTQEYAIKDIAEAAFKEIMALWEEAIAKPESEVDWTAFQEDMEKIYKDATEQVGELVNEEQEKALEKFFEDR
jgi:malonyl CoA-acyl carrier protein transacylase